MEFILGLFVGFVWWEVMVVILLCISSGISLFNESGFFTALTLTCIVGMMFGFGFLQSISLLQGFVYFALYLGAGFIWSFWKYRLFVKDIIQEYKESCARDRSYQSDYEEDTPDKFKAHILNEVKSERNYDVIAFWIIFWPGSAIGYIFSDLVVDLVKKISKIYDMISNRIISQESLT